MVNLLPPTAKRKYVIEYYMRALTVLLFLLTAAMLVLGALMLPLWVSVEIQNKALSAPYAQAVADTASYVELEDKITSANLLVNELDRVRRYEPLLPRILLIHSLAGSEVVINSVAEQRTKEGVVAEVSVTGVAATRAALAAFRDRLEADKQFTSVALPISNLAKDLEVPFSVTITVNHQSE